MSKVYVGIDPGANGFITIIMDHNISSYPVPKIKTKVDYSALSGIFSIVKDMGNEIHCVLEDVHAIFGTSAKSTFNFGHIQGFIEGCLTSEVIPYTKVQPKKWQKTMWEGIPLIQKPITSGKTMVTDTKAMSLMAAKRLFPGYDLTATERSVKPHDGKIDSLLMAEYCKRKFR